jgi:hypothetical protein
VAIGELFGRRIRVIVAGRIVCDISPNDTQSENDARSLHVDFKCEKHTKLEPLKTSITIYGLSRDTRDRMSNDLDAANAIAWKTRRQIQAGQVEILEGAEQLALESLIVKGAEVVIQAGYGLDFATLATATILPEGLKHTRDVGWRTEITAQDNRFLWQDGFVSQTVAGGVSLYDYQKVIDASEAVQAGEESLAAFTEAFPELTQIKDLPGHKNGFVLHGQAQRNRRQLSEVLGLQPFLTETGELIYLNPTQTRAGPAVRLGPTSGLVGTPVKLDRGFYTAVSLLNHRLCAGRQVQLYGWDPDSLDTATPVERPLGAGVFRVDHVNHTGSSYSQPFYSEIALRPTAIKPSANP